MNMNKNFEMYVDDEIKTSLLDKGCYYLYPDQGEFLITPFKLNNSMLYSLKELFNFECFPSYFEDEKFINTPNANYRVYAYQKYDKSHCYSEDIDKLKQVFKNLTLNSFLEKYENEEEFKKYSLIYSATHRVGKFERHPETRSYWKAKWIVHPITCIWEKIGL